MRRRKDKRGGRKKVDIPIQLLRLRRNHNLLILLLYKSQHQLISLNHPITPPQPHHNLPNQNKTQRRHNVADVPSSAILKTPLTLLLVRRWAILRSLGGLEDRLLMAESTFVRSAGVSWMSVAILLGVVLVVVVLCLAIESVVGGCGCGDE